MVFSQELFEQEVQDGLTKTKINVILLKICHGCLIVTKVLLKIIYYDEILKIKQVSRKKSTLTTKCYFQNRD